MKMLQLSIFAITATFATAAGAEPVPATATLAAPAHQERVVGDAGIWRCSGASCSGMADTRVGLAVASCTMVASANGQVASFVAGPTSFGEAELKRCNRHVK